MLVIGKTYNELFFLCIRQMEKVVLLFVHKQKQTKTNNRANTFHYNPNDFTPQK